MLFLLIGLVVNILFAFAVLHEADKKRRQKIQGLGSPGLWFFATILCGPLMALAFWLIHCSTLNPDIAKKSNKAQVKKAEPLTVKEQLYEGGFFAMVLFSAWRSWIHWKLADAKQAIESVFVFFVFMWP